jgi:heptaprenyl diphosphate synthase
MTASIDLSRQLAEVDALMRATVANEHAMLADAAGFLVEAGGKRFRAALVLAAGQLGDGDDPRLVSCAAAIELMHLATLYHDDVMDETELRRGVATAHRRYGNARAILVGDYLFARASSVAAELGVYVSKRLADTIAEVVDGQVYETELSARTGTDAFGIARRVPSVTEHLDVLHRKTAVLIASSAHLGAWLGGCGDEVVEAVTAFGDAVGLAFQLADDLLDLAPDDAATGKLPGTDLKEGILTLPALMTLEGRVPGRAELRRMLDSEDWEAALELLRSNGSIELARARIDTERTRASVALAVLPAGPARDALAALAGLAADRSA